MSLFATLLKRKKKVKSYHRLLAAPPAKIGNSPITMGRYTYGSCHLSIQQWNEGAALHIGAFCSISANVTIMLGGNHRHDWVTTYPFGKLCIEQFGHAELTGQNTTNGDVVIGNDVWIGDGATIMSGVTIGDGAVIAARAHVVKDVAAYHIVGGNPAKTIRPRFDGETIALLQQLAWWDLPDETIRTIIPILCAEPDAAQLRALIARYRA